MGGLVKEQRLKNFFSFWIWARLELTQKDAVHLVSYLKWQVANPEWRVWEGSHASIVTCVHRATSRRESSVVRLEDDGDK